MREPSKGNASINIETWDFVLWLSYSGEFFCKTSHLSKRTNSITNLINPIQISIGENKPKMRFLHCFVSDW